MHRARRRLALDDDRIGDEVERGRRAGDALVAGDAERRDVLFGAGVEEVDVGADEHRDLRTIGAPRQVRDFGRGVLAGRAEAPGAAIDDLRGDVVAGLRHRILVEDRHAAGTHVLEIDLPAADFAEEARRIGVDGTQDRIGADTGELELRRALLLERGR